MGRATGCISFRKKWLRLGEHALWRTGEVCDGRHQDYQSRYAGQAARAIFPAHPRQGVGICVHRRAVGGDKAGNIIGVDDFDAQCVQVFANIETALKSVGAGWGNVVQFTTYLVHSQDIPKFMKYRLREFPKMFANGAYPPNTMLMVDRLVQEPFLVEVQAVAAL